MTRIPQLLVALAVVAAPSAHAAAPKLEPLNINVRGGKAKVSGSLDKGHVIPLDWAASSAVACFPTNHFDAFAGRHVLYRFELPARSVATITLRGKDPQKDVNLYAYRAAPGERLVPPEITGTSCEAKYGVAPRAGARPNPGQAESVEMVAADNPYTIYVGVAGYKGVEAGGFELEIGVVTAAPPKAGKVTAATPIAVKAGQTKVTGKLDGGVEIDLGWAQASSVACFPGNHFDAFSGKHVLYRFDLPAKATAKITLVGKSKTDDLNLYAYRAAPGEVMLPPAVTQTQCEASYKTKLPGTAPNPGAPESVEMVAIQNPYTIYVGVAGYQGVTAGEFELVVDLTTTAPPKAGRVTGFTPITVKAGQTKVSGKIDGGVEIDLDWAQASSVACFPGNHFDAFSGKHVLYRFDLPAKSTAKISLKGKSGTNDLNLYAYRAGVGERMLPPEMTATQCEASYGRKTPGTKPNPSETESVEMVAIQNPYSIYVGVAGYQGVTAGDFELVIDLTTTAPPKAGRVTSFTPIEVKPGQNKVTGKIDGGVEIDLDWAQSSSVACFPGNHFDAFSGKHVLYRFDLPAKSTAKISLKGKSGTDDLNLYAYRAGVGEKMLPPEMTGTQCEASYGRKTPGTKPNPSETESVEMVSAANPYSIYIGVAGYQGVTAGEFELVVDLVTAAAPKAGRITGFTPIEVKAGQNKVSGKIDGGVEIDLDWAQSSSVACFPGNHFEAFSGKHVLYRFDLPARSTAKISLTGKSKTADLNLYAYRAAVGERLLPPEIPGTQCEASYATKVPGTKPNPGETESVEMVAIQHPYTIYIGVAGYQGVTSGDFELVVDLVTAAPEKTGRITSAIAVPVEIGKTASLEGKLDGGVEIPLSWAANSNVACFGEHHARHFEGKHVLYRFEQPPGTSVSVKATPKVKDLDISLYVYRTGRGDTTSLPPEVPSATCEASYGNRDLERSPNPGVAQGVDGLITIGNPYTVWIGVAGAAGVTSGEYTLEVEVKAR
ncbi:MAG: hypothetical protein IT385_20480 [Deltaproteobacteria bacterium]|nr:hypothetical protein [Deltaproteobacteria bacterium]